MIAALFSLVLIDGVGLRSDHLDELAALLVLVLTAGALGWLLRGRRRPR